MFLAPPRQKGDRVPARGLPREEGTVCGAETMFQLKSDTSMAKAALCLYYIFIFNDIHLFSNLKIA